jgi:calcineurin-like phosphoesterase family protein
MIYYISDIHFDDQKVFDKCLRPFENLKQYEQEIIKKWNSKVKNSDEIYILGDIAVNNAKKAIEIISKLNGNKHLIIGNHDMNFFEMYNSSKIFKSIEFIELINDKGRKVCLCHYPLMDWMEFNSGGYHVYGHIHNKTKSTDYAYYQIKEYFKDKLAFNASVDVIGYEPVTLDQMIKLKENRLNVSYIN